MMIFTLLFVALLFLLTVAFANSSLHSLHLSQKAVASERALWAAEAGLDEAIQAILENPEFKPPSTPVEMQHSAESYVVELFTAERAPVAIPKGMVYLRSTGYDRSKTTRQVSAVVRLGGALEVNPFIYSLFADTLALDGNSSIDSFDSKVGPQPLGEKALVGTNSTEPGSITLNGSSHIKGQISIGPGGKTGTARPSQPNWGGSDVVWKNWNTWSGEEFARDHPEEFPPVDTPQPGTRSVNSGWQGETLEPGAYDSLVAGGGGTVVLKSGVYVFNSLRVAGGAKLSFEGTEPAIIYVIEELDMSNGTFQNTSMIPKNIAFLLGENSKASLTGGSQAYLTVYGPDADITMAGGTDFYGALVGRNVNVSGGARIHYDLDLIDNPPSLPGAGTGVGTGQVISRQRF